MFKDVYIAGLTLTLFDFLSWVFIIAPDISWLCFYDHSLVTFSPVHYKSQSPLVNALVFTLILCIKSLTGRGAIRF